MSDARRFPPPWSVEEQKACFVVRDQNGQQLAYVYFEGQGPLGDFLFNCSTDPYNWGRSGHLFRCSSCPQVRRGNVYTPVTRVRRRMIGI